MPTTRTRVALVTTTFAAAALIAGCGSDRSVGSGVGAASDESSGSLSYKPDAADSAGSGGEEGGSNLRADSDAAARVAARPTSGGGGAGATVGAAVAPAAPKVVKNAELKVEVGKGRFDEALADAVTAAEGVGGFVATSSANGGTDGDPAVGALTMRIPAAELDGVIRRVSKLGEVQQRNQTGEDVSGQLVDLDARIKTLQAEEEALRTILGKAANVGEVLQIQPQLFDVRQQIEQLQAQKASLDDKATFATLRLTLVEPGAVIAEERPQKGLVADLRTAWAGAIGVVGGLIVVTGYALPFLVLAAVAWAAWRIARRRRPTPALDAA